MAHWRGLVANFCQSGNVNSQSIRNFTLKFRSHKEKIDLHTKDGKIYIDILASILDGPDKSQDLSQWPNLDFSRSLLYLALNECLSKKMYFACERSIVDYLTVVQSNLVALRGILRTANETVVDNLASVFLTLHELEIFGLMEAGKSNFDAVRAVCPGGGVSCVNGAR